MAVKWDGFSEEDITKMKSVSNGEDAMERPKTKSMTLCYGRVVALSSLTPIDI